MKKKGLFFKALVTILVLCLTITTCPVFAAESETQHSTEDKLWLQSLSQTDYNFEGDLSLEELKNAELAPEDTPEIVPEENIKEKEHVNRLWEQEEDLNTIVFQNRDGTKTAYHFSNPVKYTDETGEIKDKSNKLSKTSDGNYTNAQNDINVYFPKKIHKNKGVELRFGEYIIEVAPNINGSSGACRQTGHDKYSAPTEYVQYPDVFGDAISLRYTPTFDGYKEDIILSEKPKQNEFEFKVTTNGLSIVQTSTGGYYLAEPSTGKHITSLGDIVIYDNNGTESEGYNHSYKITPITENKQYLITIIVDQEYLESESTIYPVYVDPTLTALSQGFVEDATLYSNKDETSYDSGLIKIGYTPSYGISRGLFKFPLSSFEDDFTLMYGNQIVSAELNLYAVGYSDANEQYNDPKTLSLYEFNRSWSSYTVNWNNTDAHDYGKKICSVEAEKHWLAFDITYVINKFKTDVNYTTNFKGLLLKAPDNEEDAVGTWKKIVSSSGTADKRPYITITYNYNPPPCQQIVSGNIFYLKNRYNQYLDVYNGGTANNTRLRTYSYNGNTRQQFKITNVTGGEYIITPMHTTGKVVSATADGDVVIEENQNLWRQRWFIYYRNGKYHIVNKKYRKGVMSPTLDSNYITINREYDYCCWELEEIEYTVLPTSVTLSQTSATVNVGQSFDLNATVAPNNTSQTVIWSSSNSNVATVSNQGLVTSTGAGTATITARSKLNNNIYATCTVKVEKLKIYQTRNTFLYDENGNSPEDLEYCDISESALKDLDWINWSDFVGTDADNFKNTWEFMCTSLFATEPLQNVISDMINHFMEGTGNNYSHSALTDAAYNHESTQTYINAIKLEINELLQTYNGDISSLTYYASSRDNNPLVMHMNAANINQPVFDTLNDTIDGLTICVDSLWGNQIEVKSYKTNGNSYEGTLSITLYDHFGLDEADVEKYGFLAGFRSWYILQHSKTYSGAYKPFVTIMEFDIPFSGNI